MKYICSYRFLFDSPNWLMNLLVGVVSQFVPVLGPMVLGGYAFEIIETLHRRKGAPYPDFDTNQLMKYLTRGVWPFVVIVLISLPLAAIIIIVSMCFGVGMAIGSAKDHPFMILMLIAVFYLAIFVLLGLRDLVVIPFALRAGLIQDFKPAFSLEFAKDFVKRVWLEMVLAELFLVGTGIVLSMVGMMVFCVGVYVAAALITYAHYHLLYQLYELYLERGGMAIPLKPEPVTTSSAEPPPPDAPPSESVMPADEP
jgi:hypothetical protein